MALHYFVTKPNNLNIKKSTHTRIKSRESVALALSCVLPFRKRFSSFLGLSFRWVCLRYVQLYIIARKKNIGRPSALLYTEKESNMIHILNILCFCMQLGAVQFSSRMEGEGCYSVFFLLLFRYRHIKNGIYLHRIYRARAKEDDLAVHFIPIRFSRKGF